jgi:hypothetical protein
MARGEHPQRTPFYGAPVIVSAMLAGLAVQVWFHPPTGSGWLCLAWC